MMTPEQLSRKLSLDEKLARLAGAPSAALHTP
jgi:hypothetical protein